MTTAPNAPNSVPEPEHVTFRVRRTRVWGSVGLVAGFMLGFAVAIYVLPALHVPPAASPPPLAAAAPTAPAKDTAVKVIDIAGRPTRGPADAPVTIVEFTDYECPFCRDYFSTTLPAIAEKYGDRLRYVVMNYPLETLHPHAVGAAEAAECADAQGKFWEYHDALFVARSLTPANLRRLGAKAKLDAKAFAACLDTREKSRLVQRHSALGTSLGVTGTPTLFINGRLFEGAGPLVLIEQMIDSALAVAARK